MKKLFLALVAVSIFTLSCKKDDNNTDITGNHVVSFVKLNNKWTYDYYLGDVKGDDHSWEIIENLENNFFKIKISKGNINSYKYWHSNSEGFSEDAYSYPPSYYFTLVKNNQSLNDQLTYTFSDDGVNYVITRKVEAINETVTVAAGTFSCIKIKETVSNDTNIVNYYWINKETGIVQRYFTGWFDEGNGKTYFTEKFYLKQAVLN
jgi:hypothetical protein